MSSFLVRIAEVPIFQTDPNETAGIGSGNTIGLHT